MIDSRVQREGGTIRRRRECLGCGMRFSTLETIVREGLTVVKRDGTREDFDRSKLLGGLRRAIHKRPVQAEQLELLVDSVLAELEAGGEEDIQSRRVGELVMERLKKLDAVAYVRYASVYKRFQEAADFTEEVHRLAQPATETP